jgi:hypothetical protein
MSNDVGPDARGDTAVVAKEVVLLLNLAICRTRGNVFAGEEVKDLICGILEEGKLEILLIEEKRDRVSLEVVPGGKEVRRDPGGTPGVSGDQCRQEKPGREHEYAIADDHR